MNDNKNSHKNSIFERKEENMTHGVEIDIWKDSQNKIFSLWDFAANIFLFYFIFYFIYFIYFIHILISKNQGNFIL
jgi:hypothetical protein